MLRKHARTILLVGALASSAVLFTPRAGRSQVAATYTRIDLGVTFPSGITPSGINSNGVVCGYGGGHAYRITPQDTNGDQFPDVWYRDANGDGLNDLQKTLPMPSSRYTWGLARGVNSGGQVVGTMQGSSISLPETAGIWSGAAAGTAQLVDSSKDITEGYGLNDLGDVVGYLSPKKGGLRATLWRNSNGSYTATDLGIPAGFDGSLAVGVNSSRSAIGWLYQNSQVKEGFVWGSAGGMRRIGQLPGHLSNMLNAVNGNGQAVGSTNAGGVSHALLWLPQSAYGLPAGLNDLVGLNNNDGSAGGINSSGAIVGSSGGRAAIWQDGLWQDLNTLTSNLAAGEVLTSAGAISDTGLIVGFARFGGAVHAVVLSPR